MRILLAFLVLASGHVCAADKDTLPLQRKTSPDAGRKSILDGAVGEDSGKVGVHEDEKPKIGSVGVFGTQRLNEVTLRELIGKDMDTWIKKGLAADPTALDLEKKIVEKVKKKYEFPFAEWSIIQYFQPDGLALHLTLDVVERKDLARRMPFESEPTEELTDPDGLLAKWVEYENLALDLVETAEIQPEAERCAALHCPFGHKHEKLKKYEKLFLDGATKNSAALVKILKSDKRPEFRAAAAYMLAYWVDQKKRVVEVLLDRLRDPDALVRNNALRVLGDIAEFHADIPIPLGSILPALDYPKVSDRSKALYVTYLLSLNSSQVRDELMKSSLTTLIGLMECKQPDHKELAHNILRKISGKDFPATDVRAWTAWYKKLPQGKEISKK